MSKELILQRAKDLYHDHLEISHETHPFMWGQCSTGYQEAWLLIAEEELMEYSKSLQEVKPVQWDLTTLQQVIKPTFDGYQPLEVNEEDIKSPPTKK
jgi:hypothetical protein